jgi:hypothetical protein
MAEASQPAPLDQSGLPELTAAGFREGFGEELHQVLDLRSWNQGWDLSREYPRLQAEVREAIERETDYQRGIRKYVFPRLRDPAITPKGGGAFRANPDVLATVQRGLLFNGGVEACDGTVATHDSLPLTVYHIGVSLVSYRGNQGTWHQRLYRRDLRRQGPDPVANLAELLKRRDLRAARNRDGQADGYGELVRRALMTYAERAYLLDHATPTAVWRMGHGNPVPYELLTGGGNLELMVAASRVMRRLIEVHRKFVFVASEPREGMYLTIGQALRPGEYAIVGTLRERLEHWVRQGRFTVGVTGALDWDGELLPPVEWIPRFIERVAAQVAVGVYRATRLAPAHLFYAHVEQAHLAAHIALADSRLQEHRGFPLLIDLADHVCETVFGGTLGGLTQTAYAAAGAPWRYFSERSTRP